MVEYDQLVFDETDDFGPSDFGPLTEKMSKEHLHRLINEGSYNWSAESISLDEIEILGSDSLGGEKVLVWLRIPAVHSDAMTTYYDTLGTPHKDSPVEEKYGKELFEKYYFFRSLMESFHEASHKYLQKLEKEYNLEIHVKPDVIKDTMHVIYIYDGKMKFEVNKNERTVRGIGRLETHILNSLDSLPFEDKLQLRTHRAKTALKDLFDIVSDEFAYKVQFDLIRSGIHDAPAHARKILAQCLKNNKEINYLMHEQVSVYKNLKKSLAKILNFETKLIKAGKSDILKFDKAVQSLLDCAKNPTGRQFFDVQYMKTMSECYGIKPTYKSIKPKTDVLRA